MTALSAASVSTFFSGDSPLTTASVDETMELGCRLAERLSPGSVVALSGDLGTGKTHLVKGIADGLGYDPAAVRSPTFTIVHVHEGARLPLYHFDLYRLQTPDELYELGYEEYVYGTGVTVVEWPERAADLLPDDTLWIRLTHSSAHERTLTRIAPSP